MLHFYILEDSVLKYSISPLRQDWLHFILTPELFALDSQRRLCAVSPQFNPFCFRGDSFMWWVYDTNMQSSTVMLLNYWTQIYICILLAVIPLHIWMHWVRLFRVFGSGTCMSKKYSGLASFNAFSLHFIYMQHDKHCQTGTVWNHIKTIALHGWHSSVNVYS